jgi:hypothetical protein
VAEGNAEERVRVEGRMAEKEGMEPSVPKTTEGEGGGEGRDGGEDGRRCCSLRIPQAANIRICSPNNCWQRTVPVSSAITNRLWLQVRLDGKCSYSHAER